MVKTGFQFGYEVLVTRNIGETFAPGSGSNRACQVVAGESAVESGWMRLGRGFELVTLAPGRDDQVRMLVVLSKLASQSMDVDLEDIWSNQIFFSPDLLHQVLVRHGPADIGGQQGQQPVFCWS